MSNAFVQQGATVNLAVTGTAQALSLPNGADTLRIANIGTQTVFINFQATATVANGIPVMANSVEVFGQGGLTSVSAIAAGTGSTLYATSGQGS